MLLLLVCALFSCIASGQEILYKFSDGAGTVLRDESGNGNDAEIVGGSWSASSCHNPPCYYLEGDADFIRVPTGSLADISNISVAFWLRKGSTTNRCAFSASYNGERIIDGWVSYSGSTFIVVGNGSTFSSHYVDQPHDQSWHHYVFIASDIVYIYIDGSLQLSEIPGVGIGSTIEYFYIGQYASNYFEQGYYDDFTVFLYALSADEVYTLYQEGSLFSCPSGCDENADCVGENLCSCYADFYGPGETCEPCGANASSPKGSTSVGDCVCNDGYAGSGIDCMDIDECLEGSHSCGLDAICINTDGGYTCTCPDGYVGDGYSGCYPDVNECEDGTHDCTGDTTCADVDNGYTCLCPANTYGDGTTCTKCAEHATSPVGSTSWEACDCPENYIGDGYSYCSLDYCFPGQYASGNECYHCGYGATSAGGLVDFSSCYCRQGYRGDPEDGCSGVLGRALFRLDSTLENSVFPYTPLSADNPMYTTGMADSAALELNGDLITIPPDAFTSISSRVTIMFWYSQASSPTPTGTIIDTRDNTGKSVFAIHMPYELDPYEVVWEYRIGQNASKLYAIDFGARRSSLVLSGGLAAPESLGYGGDSQDLEPISTFMDKTANAEPSQSLSVHSGSLRNVSEHEHATEGTTQRHQRESRRNRNAHPGVRHVNERIPSSDAEEALSARMGTAPPDSDETTHSDGTSRYTVIRESGFITPEDLQAVMGLSNVPDESYDSLRGGASRFSRRHRASGTTADDPPGLTRRELRRRASFTHYTFTHDTSTDSTVVYLNGHKWSGASIPPLPLSPSSFQEIVSATLGGDPSGNIADGIIDELVIVPEVLSNEEISTVILMQTSGCSSQPCGSQACYPVIGTTNAYVCGCEEGYYLDVGDQCALCPANANSPSGSIDCVCNSGYVGDGESVCEPETVTVATLSLGDDRIARRPDKINIVAELTFTSSDGDEGGSSSSDGSSSATQGTWRWAIISGDEGLCGLGAFNLSEVSTSQAVIPAYTLSPQCFYNVACVYYYRDSEGFPREAHASVKLSIVHSTLYVAISGGGQTIPYDSEDELMLSAASSYDPDYPDDSLSFAWELPSTVSVPSGIPLNQATLTVPLGYLQEGEFEFRVYGWSLVGDPRNTTTTAAVELKYGVPSVSTTVLYPEGKESRINANDKLTISASIEAEYDTTLLWSAATSDGSTVDLNSIALTALDRSDLAIGANSLTAGETYTFTVLVSHAEDPTLYSTAKRSISINRAPSGGQCIVSPESGVPAIETITSSCSGWSDDSGGQGLTYSLVMIDPDYGWEVPLRTYTSATSAQFTLPDTDKDSVEVRMYIKDIDGAQAMVQLFVGVDDVDSPSACESTSQFVDVTMPQLMHNGLYDQALTESKSWGSLLSNSVCEDEMRNVALAERLTGHVRTCIQALGCDTQTWSDLAASVVSDQLVFVQSFTDNNTYASVELMCTLSTCLDTASSSAIVSSDSIALLADGLSLLAGKVTNTTMSNRAQGCLEDAISILTSSSVPGEAAVLVRTRVIRACAYHDRTEAAGEVLDLSMASLCGEPGLPDVAIPDQSGSVDGGSGSGFGSGVGVGAGSGITEAPDVTLDVIMWEPGTHVSEIRGNRPWDGERISNVTSIMLYFDRGAVFEFDPPIEIKLGLTRSFESEECLEEDPVCEYYNVQAQDWEEYGCETYGLSDGTVLCECTHLTDFSVIVYENEEGNRKCVYAHHHDVFVALSALYGGMTFIFALQLYFAVTSRAFFLNKLLHTQTTLFSLLRTILSSLAASSVLDDIPFLVSSLLDSIAYMLLFSVFSLLLLSVVKAVVYSTSRTNTVLGPLRNVYVVLNITFFVALFSLYIGYMAGGDIHAIAISGQVIFMVVSFAVAFCFLYYGKEVIVKLEKGAALRHEGGSNRGVQRIILLVEVFGTSFICQGLLHLISIALPDVFIDLYGFFAILVFLFEGVCLSVVFYLYHSPRGIEYLRSVADKVSLLGMGMSLTGFSGFSLRERGKP